MLDADITRLTQIFSNLLINAAKYTPPGGRIHLEAKPTGNSLVEVRVRDTGVGIPPEMLEKIFEPFVQVTSASMMSPGGLGIGLSLVRKLVELHGGELSATSAGANQGSEFCVKLPALSVP